MVAVAVACLLAGMEAPVERVDEAAEAANLEAQGTASMVAVKAVEAVETVEAPAAAKAAARVEAKEAVAEKVVVALAVGKQCTPCICTDRSCSTGCLGTKESTPRN
jgi:hypothetical protein